MRIKKHSSGNEYIRAGEVWVRNFTKEILAPLHISHMFDKEDYQIVLHNEELNRNHPPISSEEIVFKKLVIVSDGFHFGEKHSFLRRLPEDVGILAINRALRKWSLMSSKLKPDERRAINAYVTNNPYEEVATCLPPRESKYYPVCIASTRTNSDFLKKYLGDVYTYSPTPEPGFGVQRVESYYIDDYRNPICAAIGLAHRFDVEKLMLFACDDTFANKRDFAVQLENGLWTYPQHLKSHAIIDANLYWLTHQKEKEVKVCDYSSGPEYANAAYISNEEDALEFFKDQVEGILDDK